MAIKVQGTTIVDDSQALRITGVSSFTNGPVLIGGGTSTGTASQPLQITGGAYISTSTGIGTTNPLQSLHVLGNLLVAAGSSTGQHITQKAYELNSGTLSWEGSAGQLFSITNSLTSGSIFSVNDVSGIPSIDVNADGTIALAPYGTTERVGVGTTAPTAKLDVIGNARVTGVITATTFNGQVNAGVSTLGITSTTNLTTQNINNSGITTTNSLNIGATQVISSGRQLQNIASLDATTTATIESAIANAPNTFNDLNVTGISTLGITSTTNLTTQQLNVSGVSTFAGIATHTASLFGTQASFSGVVTATTFSGSVTNATYATSAGVATYATSAGIATYATSSGIATYAPTAGISTSVIGGIGSITQLSVSGISTLGVTSATNLTAQQLSISGLSTFTAANAGAVQIRSGASGSYTFLDIGRTSSDFSLGMPASGGQFATDSAVGDAVIRLNTGKILFTYQGNNSSLAVAGNNVLVGTVSSTGTASQPLQVSGGGYFSSNLGVGRTNPSALFHLTGGAAIGAIIERNTTGESYIRYQNSSGTVHAGISTGATFWGIGDSTNFTTSPYFVVTNTTGFIGIGTTNPTSKLHVVGDVLVSEIGRAHV